MFGQLAQVFRLLSEDVLQLRGNFEKSHKVKDYPEWPVMGSAWDFIMPTNMSRPDVSLVHDFSFQQFIYLFQGIEHSLG